MGSIIVVTAPSGCGKSTLINAYMKVNQNTSFAISHTTRAIRGREQDGVEYHFVDVPTFKKMISNHEFIEWALVHDNYYGTSKKELENIADGHTIILDIDVQGAVALQKMNVDALFVFIKPPSIEDLKNRLVGRNTDSEDVIEKRLWNARRELENEHLFHTVIVNSELDKAQKKFDEVILAYQERVIETPQTDSAEPQDVANTNEPVVDNESGNIENNGDNIADNTIETENDNAEVVDSGDEVSTVDDIAENAEADNIEANNSDSVDSENENTDNENK